MKHSHTISKTAVMKTLKSMGLSATRTTNATGSRVWKLSDGREYASLAGMADALKVPQTA